MKIKSLERLKPEFPLKGPRDPMWGLKGTPRGPKESPSDQSLKIMQHHCIVVNVEQNVAKTNVLSSFSRSSEETQMRFESVYTLKTAISQHGYTGVHWRTLAYTCGKVGIRPAFGPSVTPRRGSG